MAVFQRMAPYGACFGRRRVADSVGEQEYQESLDKINLFMDALKSGV